MSNFTDFIGGGGGGSYPTIFLHNSQTWVPPQDGNIMIHVIGAGGSGSGANSTSQVESGAAGGYCRKNSLAVTTSGTFTVIIGSGGVGTLGVVGAGTAGGTTSVSGTGLPAGTPLRAFGGAGGALNVNTYTTGGVATGGDVNYTGGRGGYRKGGGAVGLTGTGNDGFVGTDWGFTAGGGNCDILGDFYSSTLGQLSGGLGGDGVQTTSSGIISIARGEPLAGSGSVYKIVNSMYSPDATIGGGGGWTYGAGAANRCWSGRGGEGCVVIQYIP